MIHKMKMSLFGVYYFAFNNNYAINAYAAQMSDQIGDAAINEIGDAAINAEQVDPPYSSNSMSMSSEQIAEAERLGDIIIAEEQEKQAKAQQEKFDNLETDSERAIESYRVQNRNQIPTDDEVKQMLVQEYFTRLIPLDEINNFGELTQEHFLGFFPYNLLIITLPTKSGDKDYYDTSSERAFLAMARARGVENELEYPDYLAAKRLRIINAREKQIEKFREAFDAEFLHNLKRKFIVDNNYQFKVGFFLSDSDENQGENHPFNIGNKHPFQIYNCKRNQRSKKLKKEDQTQLCV